MRPPECDVCGADADVPGGGLVTFLPRASALPATGVRDPSRLAPREVGHPDDSAWLCPAHHAPGRVLAGSVTRREALTVLRPSDHPDRPPRATTPSMPEPPPGESTAGGVVDLAAFAREARGAAGEMMASLGGNVDAAGAPTDRTRRDWTPMDGVQPPHCPYVDLREWRIGDDEASVTVTEEWAYWSDDDLARVAVTVEVRGSGSDRASVALHPPQGVRTAGHADTSVRGDLPLRLASLLERLGLAPGGESAGGASVPT